MANLKEKTISSLIWSSIERFGYTFIMFIANLVLARILEPSDFGIVAITTVFIAIASIIVDGGFTGSIIQKKELLPLDCETAFTVNFGISILLYIVLFVLAPIVSNIFNVSELDYLIRVLGLVLITNSLTTVQISRLKRELQFKTLSIVSIVSAIIGTLFGIFAAFNSFGVWSLVIQNLTISIVKIIILQFMATWKPKLRFSKARFKEQFSFGFMLLLSNLIESVYANSISLVLGRAFTPKTLGLYSQARTFENVPSNTLLTIVYQVTFPIMSEMYGKKQDITPYARQITRNLAAIIFPLMTLLIILAKPLIITLFTEKWEDAVILFQIACIGGMITPFIQINNSILLACGKSKLFFRSRLICQFIGFIIISFLAFNTNLMQLMIIGVALLPYLMLFIMSQWIKKILYGFGFFQQIKSIGVLWLLCIIPAALILVIVNISNPVNELLWYIASAITFILIYAIVLLCIYPDIIPYIKGLWIQLCDKLKLVSRNICI